MNTLWIRGQCSTPGPTHGILPNQPRWREDKNHFLPSDAHCLVMVWIFSFRPINTKFNASSQLVQQIKSLLSTSQHRELFLQKNHQSRSFFLLSLRDKLLWGDQSDLAVVQRKSSWLHFASRQWMEVSFSILQMNCRGLLEPVLWLFPSCLRTVTSRRSVFAGRIVKLLVQ